jgi:hypothetical protein
LDFGILEEKAVQITDNSIWDHTSTLFEDNLGRLWVTWTQGPGRTSGNIWARLSCDSGLTWNDPIQLTFSSSNDWFPYGVVDTFGTLWLFWSSNREIGDYNIWYMNSSNNGYSWSQPFQLTSQPTDEYNPCALVDEFNVISLFYWADSGSNRNVYSIKSNNLGISWEPINIISESSYWEELTDCHISSSGKIYLFVQQKQSLWAAYIWTSIDNGVSWMNEGITPYSNYGWGTVFTDREDNIYALYEQVSGNVYYRNKTEIGWSPQMEITGALSAFSPKAFVDSKGNLVLTWYSNTDGDMEVFVKTYSSFTDPLDTDYSEVMYIFEDHESSLSTWAKWSEFIRTQYPLTRYPIGEGRGGYYWAPDLWSECGYCTESLCNAWGTVGTEIFSFPISGLGNGNALITIKTKTPATYSWFKQIQFGVYINENYIGSLTSAPRGEELWVCLEFPANILSEGDNNIFIVYDGGTVGSNRLTQLHAVKIAYPTDQTPPEISVALNPIEIYSPTEGLFQVEFNVIDDMDPNPTVIAIIQVPLPEDLSDWTIKLTTDSAFTLKIDYAAKKLEIKDPNPETRLNEIQLYGGILVENDQILKIKLKDVDKFMCKDEKGIWKFEAPEVILQVTAIDYAGNVATAYAFPTFPPP